MLAADQRRVSRTNPQRAEVVDRVEVGRGADRDNEQIDPPVAEIGGVVALPRDDRGRDLEDLEAAEVADELDAEQPGRGNLGREHQLGRPGLAADHRPDQRAGVDLEGLERVLAGHSTLRR